MFYSVRTFLDNEELSAPEYHGFSFEKQQCFLIVLDFPPHLLQSSCQCLFWKLLFKTIHLLQVFPKVQLYFIEVTTHFFPHSHFLTHMLLHKLILEQRITDSVECNTNAWSEIHRHELRESDRENPVPGGAGVGSITETKEIKFFCFCFYMEEHCPSWQIRFIRNELRNVHWICQAGCLLTLARLV